MSRKAEEVSEKQRKQKELDSILDAALDELDIDEDDECDSAVGDSAETSKLPSLEKEKPTKTKDSAENNAGVEKEASHSNVSEEELAASLEDMMKQFLQVGGQLEGDDGGLDDNDFESFIKSMQSQVLSDMRNSSAKDDKPSPRKEKKEPKESTTAKKSCVDENDVDRTVEKLLEDMAKARAGGDGLESENMGEAEEEMMASLLKEFDKIGENGDADELVDGMMRQLLSKELMYEPMKQVTERFPKWLEESKPKLSEDDYIRYGHQYEYFQRIIAVYENEPDNFPRLLELMQDIQEYGQPPAEIIKEIAPGLELDEDGVPKMDSGMPGMPFLPGNEQCSVM